MRMRILILWLVLAGFSVSAQRKMTPTDAFRVTGKVKKESRFTVSQLDSFPQTALKDQVIYNHKGETKDTIKNLKGVLLTEVLKNTTFVYDKPKDLSEFYLVCIASDGYKVVFSWNELYNTDIGKTVYLLTQIDGKPLKDIEQRMVLLCVADFKSGRRYVKSLDRIEVKRVE